METEHVYENFEQAWGPATELLEGNVLLPLQDYLVFELEYDPTFVLKLPRRAWFPSVYTVSIPTISRIYRLCTQKSPFNFSAQVYAKAESVFDTFYSIHCFPRVRSSMCSFQLFCHQLHRCLWAHKILLRTMTGLFTYLNRYYVQNNKDKRGRLLLTIEEVGCRSFHRNVLDPLLDHNGMTLSRSIIVKHVSRIISGVFLSEPAAGTIVYLIGGRTTVKPQSSLVQSHGRIPDLQEFNNAIIRSVYPFFQSLTFAAYSLRHDVSAGVFEFLPQETLLSGLSADEWAVRSWLSQRLPADTRLYILIFLVPEIARIPRHVTI